MSVQRAASATVSLLEKNAAVIAHDCLNYADLTAVAFTAICLSPPIWRTEILQSAEEVRYAVTLKSLRFVGCPPPLYNRLVLSLRGDTQTLVDPAEKSYRKVEHDRPVALSQLASISLPLAVFALRCSQVSIKKRRAFAVWCLKSIMHKMKSSRSREAVLTIERVVYGLAEEAEIEVAHMLAHSVCNPVAMIVQGGDLEDLELAEMVEKLCSASPEHAAYDCITQHSDQVDMVEAFARFRSICPAGNFEKPVKEEKESSPAKPHGPLSQYAVTLSKPCARRIVPCTRTTDSCVRLWACRLKKGNTTST